MIKPPDWSAANQELVCETLRQAELRIENQIRFAVSADQRAAGLAGIYVAAGTALVAGLITLVATGYDEPSTLAGGVVAGLLFIIGAGLCIITALPRSIHVSGNDPENWYNDIRDNKNFIRAIGETVEFLQEGITENRKLLYRNGRMYLAGAISGMCAPVFGVVIWLLC